MSEAEKQEGQKTVVAFITGLLIGGLLVWVFSSAPESTAPTTTDEDDTTTEQTESEATKNENKETVEVKKETQIVGNGSLSIGEQKAGTSVTLGEVKYPTTVGWIVVRELADGMPANILGAARFDTEVGLLPTQVELQRETVAGGSYQASFFTEDGDKDFKLGVDVPVTGGEATFKAI